MAAEDVRHTRSTRGRYFRWWLLLALGGCQTKERAPSRALSAAPVSRASGAEEVRLRLELATSPYEAALVRAQGRVALLAPGALYWLPPANVEPIPLPMDGVGVATADSLVRYEAGALRRFDFSAQRWSALASMAEAPRMLAASGERVAWLQAEPSGGSSVWTLAGSQALRLVTAPVGIATLAMRDDRVFFVEELPAGRWRLGVMGTADGTATYAKPWSGRAPAALAVTSEVFFYDGPSLSVYRVSTDLQRTELVGKEVICSPLAAATSLFCAQPGGVLELPLSGGERRVIASPRSFVTDLLATESELTWVREGKSGGLVVESVKL